MRMNPKTLLLASAAVAALAVPALADSYYFRTKPTVEPVRAFSFDAVSNKNPGAIIESSVVRISGYRGKTASVSGGEYQVCATATCSDQSSWKTSATSGLPADFYSRVRVTAAAFGQTATARLTVGDASATFDVGSRAADLDPDPVTIAATVAATSGQPTSSPIVKLTGHDGITVSATNASFRICATATCSQATNWLNSAATADKDTWVQLQATSPAPGATANPLPTLHYGGRTAAWSLSSVQSTGATYAAMGISDANLASALSTAAGSEANWIQCTYGGSGGTETCTNAKETLVVYTGTSTTYTFGVYVQGDIATKQGCWYDATGLYFSNAPTMGGYIRNDKTFGIGTVGVCNSEPNAYMFLYGLYWLRGSNPESYFPNGAYAGGSVTGAKTGVAVSGTVKWYKRR